MNQLKIERQQWIHVALVAPILIMAVMLLPAARAIAHEPGLLDSDPDDGAVLQQAPPQVVISFSEELLSELSTLQIYDEEGHQVDAGDGGVDLNDPDHARLIVSLPFLPDGQYTVHWRTLLVDGDIVEGTRYFVVGENVAIPHVQAASTSHADRKPSQPVYWVWGGVAIFLIVIISMAVALRQRSRTEILSENMK